MVTIVLGVVLLVVLAGCVIVFMRRARPRPVLSAERCEVCADVADHRVVSILDDDPVQGGTAMAADFCAEHCPGGCLAGCATIDA